MRLYSCAFLAFLALAVSGQAKIGETQIEIEQRLGKPIATTEGQALYEKNGFRVGVVYQKGLSVLEVVNVVPAGKEIPNDVRAMLFAVYGSGQEWKQIEDQTVWRRADGKIVALFGTETGEMIISDANYFNTLEKEQRPSKIQSFTDVFGPVPSPAAPASSQ